MSGGYRLTSTDQSTGPGAGCYLLRGKPASVLTAHGATRWAQGLVRPPVAGLHRLG